MNPEKLIEDLFDDKNLADYNLRSFCDDHLLRLSIPELNPGGIYNTIITATNTKYNAFFGKMTNEVTKKAISQGLTVNMETAKSEALEEVSHFENLVAFKFKPNTGTYKQFYPQGVSEYYDATIDQLPTIFTRIENAANANLLASNPADVAALIAKLSTFKDARAAQEVSFAEVENLQTGRREDRQALTLQLTTNLLTIALNNLLNADSFNNYYNPSYLPLADKTTTVSGIIAAATTVMAVNEGVITGSSNITVYNLGISDLIFSINDQPGVMHPVYQKTVEAGNHYTFTDKLPVFTKYYANVQNPNAIDNGKWKIVIS